MKEIDLAYAAGLVDGEGTITLGKKYKTSLYRLPIVSLSNTCYEILDFMCTHFGGHISKHKTYQEHHLQSWSWKVSYRPAVHTCQILLPYLRIPEKIRRAILLVEVYPTLTPRNGKYTSTMAEAKHNFENEFFHPSTS